MDLKETARLAPALRRHFSIPILSTFLETFLHTKASREVLINKPNNPETRVQQHLPCKHHFVCLSIMAGPEEQALWKKGL